MSMRHPFEQRRDRVLMLISAQRRTHVALIVHNEPGGDVSPQGKSDGSLRYFRNCQCSALVEQQRAVAPVVGNGSLTVRVRSNRRSGVPGKLAQLDESLARTPFMAARLAICLER